MTFDYSTKILMGFILLAAVACWAYAHIVVKKLKHMEAVQINLYFAFVLTLTNAFLYPFIVTDPVAPVKFLISIGACGFPIALSAFMFITALKINHNSGLTTMFIFSSVVVGYLLSLFRYD
jgi:hypothetical protein